MRRQAGPPPGPTDPYVARLLSRAHGRTSARQANAAIAAEREAVARRTGAASSFEVVLPPGADAALLCHEIAPRLARHLRAQGASAERPPASVFLSLFVGDTLLFVDAEELFAVVREAEGLSPSAFSLRVQRWEAESA